jgi:hypothetical protein
MHKGIRYIPVWQVGGIEEKKYYQTLVAKWLRHLAKGQVIHH